jgi:hypothetical protein
MRGKQLSDYTTITKQAAQEGAHPKANAPLPPPPGQQEEAQRKAKATPPLPSPAQKAENLHELLGATLLYGASGAFFAGAIDVPTFKIYLDRFLKDAGASTDPLERQLLEQLVLAHHAIGRLHFRAGTCKDASAVTAYLAAVARLMAESRRTTIAVQAYRQAPSGKQEGATRPEDSPNGKRPSPAMNGHADGCGKSSSGTEEGTNNRLKELFHEHEPALS